MHVNIQNEGYQLTQCWQGKNEILEMSTHLKIKGPH